MTIVAQDNSSTDLRLYVLAQQFLEEHRSNDEVTLADFAARHPDLEAEINDTFPGLFFAEDLRAISEVPESPPKTIGCYALLHRIGTGGMGTVYEAEHPTLTRRLAVKLLNNSASKTTRHRFLREAELASRLNHSNIVPLIDFAEDGGIPYISMLLIDGCSVDRLLREAVQGGGQNELLTPGVDFQRIAALGAQTASALAHAHEMGMIHRDIKPGNLILDTNGKTWVTDFGLATEFTNEADESEFAGTPRYMAPEQFDGTADERTDIYSLGLTLYELVTGSMVFQDCPYTKIAAQKSEPLPHVRTLNSAVPQALADIIMRACSVEPGRRYPSAKELQVVLNRFAHGGIAGDRRSKCRDAVISEKRVRPAILLGLCAAVCVAAILLTLKLGEPNNPDGNVRWFVSSESPLVSPSPVKQSAQQSIQSDPKIDRANRDTQANVGSSIKAGSMDLLDPDHNDGHP